MSLKEKLEIELLDARKHKNLYKKEVLQLIKADIQNVEIKNKKELSDEDVISLLNKQKKQIEDSKDWAEKANRTDLIEESIIKLQVVCSFLPKQLSKEEVEQIIKQKIEVNPDINKGKLIGEIPKENKGTVDGKIVSQLALKKIKLRW